MADTARCGPNLPGNCRRGFAVRVMEYRGYSTNPGSPSEEGLLYDAQTALRTLENRGYLQDRIIFFGQSSGGGVIVALMREHPPAAGGIALTVHRTGGGGGTYIIRGCRCAPCCARNTP